MVLLIGRELVWLLSFWFVVLSEVCNGIWNNRPLLLVLSPPCKSLFSRQYMEFTGCKCVSKNVCYSIDCYWFKTSQITFNFSLFPQTVPLATNSPRFHFVFLPSQSLQALKFTIYFLAKAPESAIHQGIMQPCTLPILTRQCREYRANNHNAGITARIHHRSL